MNWQAKKAQSQLRNALPGGAIFQLSWAPLTLRNQWQPASNSAMFAGSLFRRSFGSGGLGTIFTKQVYLCNINIFIHISPCLSIYLSIDLSIYPSIHRSIDLSIYRSIDLSIYRSIDLSIYRSIDLSIYLSLSLSIYGTHVDIYIYIDTHVMCLHSDILGLFPNIGWMLDMMRRDLHLKNFLVRLPASAETRRVTFRATSLSRCMFFPPALSVAGTLQNIASTGSCCTNTWETWGILNVTYHYIPIHTHIYRYKYTYIYI